MSIVAILEVAIGMIFTWLVMSLAGMYIQELIVSKLNWRSKMLESYISNLMADPILSRQLYDHPLIKGLHSGFDGNNRPSYIPAAQFSMALIDIIRNSPKEAALIQKTLYDLQTDIDKLSGGKRSQAQKQLDLALSLTQKALANDGGTEITNPMLDDVKKQIRKLSTDFPTLQPMIEAKFLAFAGLKKQVDSVLAEFLANNEEKPIISSQDQFKAGLAVMSLTYPDIKQAIEALTNEIADLENKANNALLLVRKNIEDWFNNSMDRLSGWYKRRAQSLAFIIGISLALLLNVDSIELTNQLWRDPTIRQALAAQAETLVQNNPNGLPTPNAGQLMTLNIQINELNIPVGWIGSGLPADENSSVYIGDGSQRLCTLTPKTGVDLFGFHIGTQCYPIINTPNFDDMTGWWLKFFGLLITGMAAAQGAPFWFDILKNIINVRAAGANSDTAKTNNAG
jgi:hypothetical protein